METVDRSGRSIPTPFYFWWLYRTFTFYLDVDVSVANEMAKMLLTLLVCISSSRDTAHTKLGVLN